MIRGLRNRHRIIFVLLGVAAPILFLVGIQNRRQVRSMKFHPPGLIIDLAVQGKPKLVDELSLSAFAVTIRLFGTAKRMVLELEPEKDYGKPDLLVYWQENDDGVLRDGAYLLGSLSGRASRRFMLPPKAAKVSGGLILYSLAHAEYVDQAGLPSMEAYRGDFLEAEE